MGRAEVSSALAGTQMLQACFGGEQGWGSQDPAGDTSSRGWAMADTGGWATGREGQGGPGKVMATSWSPQPRQLAQTLHLSLCLHKSLP